MSSETEGDSSRMKADVALIGAGWWSQGWHLPHLHNNPESRIAAIVDKSPHPKSSLDPNLVSLIELSEKYGAPIYNSVEELLQDDKVGPKLDGVLVATPHATHYSIGKVLLEEATKRHKNNEKPLHILMEKPMTTDVDEAHKMYKLVHEYKEMGGAGSFLINHSANYRAQTRKAQEMVADGLIGDIRHVTGFFASPLMWIFDNVSNPGWNEANGTMLGNGFAWGQSSHLLGWIFHVCGKALVPKQVFCAMNHSGKTGADIAHAATVIGDKNVVVSISGTTLLPGNEHTEENPVDKQVYIHVYGTKGAILYSGTDMDDTSGRLELRRTTVKDGNPEYPCGPDVGFHFESLDQGGSGPESLRAFLDACHGRTFYEGADIVNGLRTIQTLEAMYRSNHSRQLEDVHYQGEC